MIRKAIFWTFAGQIASFLIMFGGSVVIARLLSPREMGIYAVSVATIGILQVVASFGIGNYIVRETQLDAKTLDSAFTVNAVICLGLSFSIFCLSFAGARFLSEPAVAPVMRLLAITPLISIFEFRPSAMMQREMKFQRLSIVTTVQAVVMTSVTIGSAMLGASYLSPAIGGLTASLVNIVIFALMARNHFSVRVSRAGWKPIASFGLRMMSIGGVSTIAARIGDIIVGHFLGLAALGLFSRASNLSLMLFMNIYGTATRVIFARMSAIYRETGDLKAPYLQGLRFIAAIMGPIQIGLAVLARPFIHWLYGEQWLGAAAPLSLLMIAQFISLRYAMNWELFVIKDELRAQTRIEFAKSIFSLISRTIGSLFTVTAAAAAAIFDAFFSIALYRNHVNRMSHATGSEFAKVTYEALLLTAVAVAPSFALMLAMDWNPATPLPLLILSIVSGVLLWVVTLALLKHPLFSEMERGMDFTRRWFVARQA